MAMKILHVVGARPNFMKVAPITREMEDGGGRMEGGREEWKTVERENENMERGGA